MIEQTAKELAQRIAGEIEMLRYVLTKYDMSTPTEEWKKSEAQYIEHLTSIFKEY